MNTRLTLALLALAGTASADPSTYERLGERPAAGEVKTRYYRFAYSMPASAYEDLSWLSYRDKAEKRNSILMVGSGGLDSYALSVLFHGKAAEGSSALAVAGSKHPALSFATGPNPACVNTSLERPFHLDQRMAAMLAVCVDPKSQATYELSISWNSAILALQSIDELAASTAQCQASQAEAPARVCSRRIGDFTKAFEGFLASFRMTGR